MTSTQYRFAMGAVLLSAAGLLLIGSWLCYTTGFDTATVGLMAVNILHQGDRPLFFYGQPYFGALEAYLAALYLSVFGFSEFILSLSPITFTLGWVLFTSLLFSRIGGRRAGLVAAICCAFPGYYVFWYSIATFGGYSAILCIGTALLWLSLIIFQDNPHGIRLYLYSLCLGCLAGVGIWIHPLVFPFILTAAVLSVIHIFRQRFPRDIICAYGMAVLVSLLGFLPFYLETGSFFGGLSEPVHISGKVVVKALSTLFSINILELIVWNFGKDYSSAGLRFCLRYGPLVLLGLLMMLSLVTLARERGNRRLLLPWLIPLCWCLLFLCMYVQHHMATIKAPRYAIGFYCMALGTLWSFVLGNRQPMMLKKGTLVLFVCWICFQVTGTVLFFLGNSENTHIKQNEVKAVVDAARRHNLHSVQTFGSHLFGLQAQKFSLFSENRIVFAHTDLERYPRNAQVLETDLQRGYLTTASSKQQLEQIFQALNVEYSMQLVGKYTLFYDVVPKNEKIMMRSLLPPEILTVTTGTGGQQDAGCLLDRCQDEGLDLSKGGEFVFDAGNIVSFCGVWLFSPQDSAGERWKGFAPYEIAVSDDGRHFNTVYRAPLQVTSGFYSGPGIFIGGLLGKGEALFQPTMGRYLSLKFSEKQQARLSEVFLFHTVAGQRTESPDELPRLAEIVRQENLDFVLANRWVSARLREEFLGSDRQEISLPRHTTKYRDAKRFFQYVVYPVSGRGIVCERAVAEECQSILVRQYGTRVIAARHDLKNYSLFVLAEVDKKRLIRDRAVLLWNGDLPLLSKDMTLIAPWLNSIGYPVWRQDFTSTKGMFHDSWTDGAAVFYNLDYMVDHERESKLVLQTHGWRPVNDVGSLCLEVIANGDIELPFEEKQEHAYIFSLPESLHLLKSLTINSSTFVPNSRDSRQLGLDIMWLEIR